MATRLIPKTELRQRIRAELASLGEDTLVVTEHGRPKAVIVSVDRWNELSETIEDLEDVNAVLEQELSGDPGRPWSEVEQDIEARVSRSARQAG